MRSFSTLFVIIFLVLSSKWIGAAENGMERSFRVDYDNNQFLKDGKPFQFVAGQFDYFRTVPQKWPKIFRLMKAAGIHAVSFYTPWSIHNPHDGQYVWTGMANVEQFISLAIKEDLLVILRPSPMISGERSSGGLPYWLLSKYGPNIKLRSFDPDYLRELRTWYSVLMPRIKRFLYGNGGPIIMVQLENQYGNYGCNHKYMEWLHNEISSYVDDKAVLYTFDIKNDRDIECGSLPNVLISCNYEMDKDSGIDSFREMVRKHQPKGPHYVGEFYTSWPTRWGVPLLANIETESLAQGLKHMLETGASVNIYMFFGGTFFGLTAGSVTYKNIYGSVITSYDFDALLDESGSTTPKYYAICDVIEDFFPLPNITVPAIAPIMCPPPIQLRPRTTLFSKWSRFILGSSPITAKNPLTFEEINQDTGFVLYETTLPESMENPNTLQIPKLYDLATIYINNTKIGSLTRNNETDSIQIGTEHGRKLQIFVENEGRKSFGRVWDYHESRGIIGDVFFNERKLENWTITGFPFEFGSQIIELMDVLPLTKEEPEILNEIENQSSEYLSTGPIIFEEMFDIINGEVNDTYIDPSGWGKGFIIVNGFNLGRYWPLAGPQIALYVPKKILFKKGNSIVVVEQIKAPKNSVIKFSDIPVNNGYFRAGNLPKDDGY